MAYLPLVESNENARKLIRHRAAQRPSHWQPATSSRITWRWSLKQPQYPYRAVVTSDCRSDSPPLAAPWDHSWLVTRGCSQSRSACASLRSPCW